MAGLLAKRITVTIMMFILLLSGVPLAQIALSEGGSDSLSSDVLLSGLPLSQVGLSEGGSDILSSNEQRYRLATAKDLAMMKSSVGVRDRFTDYNRIVDGMGTGLAPPTNEEWDLALGSDILDVGGSEYVVPTASSLDLSAEVYFPQVRNQGSEASCAAFALTYYNFGYIEARDNGWTQAKTGNNAQLLSPAWTYNKVNGATYEGSGYSDNGRILQQIGAATWATYPYVVSDDEGFGTEAAWRSAPTHRISSYVSVYKPDPSSVVSIIKEQLGKNRPVSFAMDAYQYTRAFADGNYIMSATEYSSTYYNHGQTIVGYDNAVTDDGNVGAFKVVNSWGIEWGQAGYYWLTYEAIKEMLAFPLVYIIDLEDYQPTLLATWKFTTAPSVDTKVEVGSGSSTAPTAKVSTYFRSGTSNRLPGFMALDVSALYSKYVGGEKNYYLTLSGSTLSGTVSSFSLELYTPTYVAGSPTQIPVTSSDVPKAVPGTVTATTSAVPITVPTTPVPTTDTTPPTSRVQALPTYVRSTIVTLGVTSSDLGSGVDYMELYYRYNALGLYTKYAPSTNPTGKWTGSSISFNSAYAKGQGPYQFYSVAVDKAGNREASPTYPDAFTTIDTVAPTSSLVLQGTIGVNGAYVTNVIATITASDQWSGIASITYRLNGGIWTTYTGPITISAGGTTTLDFYAKDQAGNQGVVQSKIINIDRTIVTTSSVSVSLSGTLGLNGYYKSYVYATLKCTDLASTITYRLNGGIWKTYTSTIVIYTEGTTTLEFYSKDQAGNQGAVQSKIIKIDRTAPTSSAYLSGTLVSGYYKSPVIATLTATDSISGVSSIVYRLNGGIWTTYTGPITISAGGTTTLEFYAKDQAGNQGVVQSKIINIEGSAVIISASVSVSLSGTLGLNGYYKSYVYATLKCTDLASTITYRLNGGIWKTYTSTIVIYTDGTTTLEFYSKDQAGNQGAVQSKIIKIDRTAPASSAYLSGTLGLNGYYRSSVSVTLTASDAVSGVSSILYRLNGGVWTTYTGTITISLEGTTTLDFYAKDKAGNSGAVQSKIIKIDLP